MTTENKVWIPNDTNGESFSQVSFQKTPFEKLVEKIASEIKICLVHKSDGTGTSWVVPVHPEDETIPYSAIMANDFQIMDTGKMFGELECTAISDIYWTCSCKTNFVHHKIEGICMHCRHTVNESKERLPILRNIIKWDYIVP